MKFGDYVVYVDESGDHSMVDIDPQFPVFVLAFCIFPVKEYVEKIIPMAEQLKFDFFGHDMVILHEREIRKSMPPFDILMNKTVRDGFMQRIGELMTVPRYGVIACVIDKKRFKQRKGLDVSPYNVALEFGLERVFLQLQQRNQRGLKAHVIFEGRGKNEDRELELEFRRIMDTTKMRGMADTLNFMCVSKKTNSTGLQIADMVARPIGVNYLNPGQPNRAWEQLERKLVRSMQGRVEGYGLKIYP